MNETIPRRIGLALFLVFAAVGLLFLLAPAGVLRFMNAMGRAAAMGEIPVSGAGFYQGLAVGYMYAVTLLAWLMFRNPAARVFPFLLANAKLASSLLSFGLFCLHRPYFIYLANGVVDGLIGILALVIHRTLRRRAAASS